MSEQSTSEVSADQPALSEQDADPTQQAAVTVDDPTEPVDVDSDVDSDADSDVEDEAAFRARLRVQEGEWFVIHSYAGYENRVKANLLTRVTSLNMEPYIFDVQVPMETVTEIKNGQRKLVNRVRMPGYVLVRMDLTDESWGAVRHTPGVTGFVGHTHQPVPLSHNEIYTMLNPIFETPGDATGPGDVGDGPAAMLGGAHANWKAARGNARTLASLTATPISPTADAPASAFRRAG